MRYSKKYIIFTVVLVIAFFLKFNTFAEDNQKVDSFRGASLEASVWNPLIAKSVNEDLLSVVIDSKEYTNEKYNFFMDENLSIMMPVSLLQEALNCSAHIYGSDTLLVEKHSNALSFILDQKEADVDGEVADIVSPFTQIGEEYYVSLNDVANYMNYSYNWNVEDNQLQANDLSESTTIVPTRYDLREKYRISDIRNQGNYGTCWSFAALSAIESVLLPEETLQFSVDHMTLTNGFNLKQNDGGEYTIGMAYLASWKGPVYEADDPYGDEETDDTLNAVKHVQEMQIIDGKDYEKIKEAVFQYGGVQTSIYNALRSSQSKSAYYNNDTYGYCYIGTQKPNHDVVIIGWDDSYPKENFTMDLEGDGAFICQNSWGDDFGEDGVFYISYYDTNVGTHNVVYTDIEETDNYDHIYQSDLCGWVGHLGYNKESIYGANVFTAESDENIVAAGFYATGRDSEYDIYIVRNFEDETSFDEKIPVASGKLGNAGYYTIDFDQKIEVQAGERYAVVLHIKTPGAIHPLAIEYRADDATKNVILDDGEGYISVSGAEWENVMNVEACNICIKAFSKNQ